MFVSVTGRAGSIGAAWLALSLGSAALQGAVILSDSFDYPDGPITNAPATLWSNHSGGGSNNEALVVSRQLQLTSSRTEDVDAPLAGQPYTAGGGVTLYTSFKVNFTALPTQTGTYFAHFNAGSNHRCLVWASRSNAPAGLLRLGIGNTANATAASGQLTNDLTLNTTYTVVTRYHVATASSTIWLNPANESDPSVTASDPPLTNSISNYSFRQASGMGTLLVDDLKVGTPFADLTGSTNEPPPTNAAAFSILTYNTHGNQVEDWSTNSPQVQAIGRQMSYLNPDIITFQEIPFTNTYQMANFVVAYLPGYFLATNSGTDGYVRSVIASRFPITRSTKWLDGVSLVPFGYTNSPSTFTRDLFEAQISVPNFPQPLHVFTTHLKSGQGADDSARRSAEASAISNFFVTGFLTTNGLRPYLLTGDMNEDIARPPASDPQTIQKLISVPTGLHLTAPVNPFTGSELTFDIQSSLSRRYDYILPCPQLFSNINASQVFRTDLLTNPPPPLQTNDDKTTSDHLPVLMVFGNPYNKPFRLLSIACSNQTVALTWESVPGQPYRLLSSADLNAWPTLASNLMATGAVYSFATSLTDATRFFRVYRGP